MSVTAFFAWWTGELRGMLPASRQDARSRARVATLCLEGSGLARIIEAGGAARGEAVPLADAVANLAARCAKAVRVRVRHADCLERPVELPAAAARNFEQMLRLDLERSTPLKVRDVLSAHVVEGPASASGLVQVRHLVVKMRTVEPATTALRAAGIEVAAIDCWDADGAAALPVDFLTASGETNRPAGTAIGKWAAAAVVVLCGAAYWAQVSRQERALALLDSETARLQASVRETQRLVEGARVAGAGSEVLRRLKLERLPATSILETVTRLLPDDAWLQELRIDNDVVEIAGLAGSASALLPLFERSAHFHETSFTAPLRIEPGEKREHFRLRTRLKPRASDQVHRKPAEVGQ